MGCRVVVMKQEMSPQASLNPQMRTPPPDLLPEMCQCLAIIVCCHCLTLWDKLCVDEAVAVKEYCDHGAVPGPGVESFPGSPVIGWDPLGGLDFGVRAECWK